MSEENQEVLAPQSEPSQPEPQEKASKPQGFGSQFVIALLLLSILGILLSFINLNKRLAKLESSLSNLEATVPNLPQATIAAIMALQNGQAPSPSAAANTPQAAGDVVVSIDDDAFVGDRSSAKLAIVEFSDFNCPYCQRFHHDTLPLLLDKYIRTGQAIYVYRDYVGVGGDTTLAAAAAAECVKELVGDQAYLEVVQSLYSSSGARNTDQVKTFAAKYELDMATLDKCISEDRYRQEVIADTQAGQAVGVRGTPAFIIGAIDVDGNVTGTNLPGAQPLEVFERVIDEKLASLN